MTDLKLIEDAVRVGVTDVAAKHKERFIQQAVRDYEQSLRSELAKLADTFSTIVRSEIRDDVTVVVQITFKGRK